MCCAERNNLSRLGLLVGICALGTLVVSFVSSPWMYTKEPLPLEKIKVTTNITFKIGLWRVCPTIKRINNSIHVPSPSCSLVKYSNWDDVLHTDLGINWVSLDFAQVFITRMRSCTVLCSAAVVMVLLAVFLELLGHCNSDNKTIISCGFFILGGLSLAAGLLSFLAALSETMAEIYAYHKDPDSGPTYDYRYGWCFFTAGVALVLTKIASALIFMGYLNRYPSVDEMVRQMVPGAERKMLEYQHYSNDYHIRHSHPSPRRQYDAIPSHHLPLDRYESAECGPLLNKTPPDVCTTNSCIEFAVAADLTGDRCIEQSFCVTGLGCAAHSRSLAGQTVPITIKNQNSSAPLGYSNTSASKYGTMPHPGTTLHQGFLGVSDLGSSSSNSSSGYCGKSKTLQHPNKGKNLGLCSKKSVKIESFQVPEVSFEDFTPSKKSNCSLSYSGSAV